MGSLRKLFTVAALFAIVAIGLPVFAEQPLGETKTIVLREGQGITQALAENGCDMYWLSEVVAANNLSVDDFRRLPVGMRFSVPSDCEIAPPEDVTANSTTMMAIDLARAHTEQMAAEPQSAHDEEIPGLAEIAQQKAVISELLAAKEKLETENAALKNEGATLAKNNEEKNARIEALKSAVVGADAGGSAYGWLWIALGVLVAAFLGWVAAMLRANSAGYLYSLRQRMRAQLFEELKAQMPTPGTCIVLLDEPPIKVVDFHGKKIEFPWSSVDENGNVLRKCSCGEKKLFTKNLFSHLERAKAHADLRGDGVGFRVLDDADDEETAEPNSGVVRLEAVQ